MRTGAVSRILKSMFEPLPRPSETALRHSAGTAAQRDTQAHHKQAASKRSAQPTDTFQFSTPMLYLYSKQQVSNTQAASRRNHTRASSKQPHDELPTNKTVSQTLQSKHPVTQPSNLTQYARSSTQDRDATSKRKQLSSTRANARNTAHKQHKHTQARSTQTSKQHTNTNSHTQATGTQDATINKHTQSHARAVSEQDETEHPP